MINVEEYLGYGNLLGDKSRLQNTIIHFCNNKKMCMLKMDRKYIEQNVSVITGDFFSSHSFVIFTINICFET